MMMTKNMMDQINKVKVNRRYDMSFGNILDLLEDSGGDQVRLLCKGFRFGYLQGVKAAKAEARKAGAAK